MAKIVYIIPHTHWDREWYFTEGTSNILLQRLADDLYHNYIESFTLDGQALLFYDILKNNPNYKEKLNKKVLKSELIVGPLFVQQDMLNTTLATTQLNIELGKKYSPKFQDTVYMPDTFGFNKQLPQIFKKNNFNNFVFWRGIKTSSIQNSNQFYWKGIDGTKIKSSCLSNGYYVLGQYYPYNDDPEKVKAFHSHLIREADLINAKNNQNVLMIPLGGDQAPLEKNLKLYIKESNQKQNKYLFKIGSFNDYFNNLLFNTKVEIEYPLYYSGTSKIHRSIHSNRFDIKKLFREAENLFNLSYLPLKSMYLKNFSYFLTENFEEENIIIPLLKSSAHDSLGACNSDKTNEEILVRLKKVNEILKSSIDYMVRDLNSVIGSKDKIIVYNQMPFKRDVFGNMIISNNNQMELMSKNNEIIEVSQADLSWSEKVINHNVFINVKSINPYSFKIIDLIKYNNDNTNGDLINKKIKIGLKNEISINNKKFNFKLEDDAGDEFDFSTSRTKKISYPKHHKILKSNFNNKIEIINIESTINHRNSELKIMSRFIIFEKKVILKISLKNSMSNIRLSLVVPESNNIELSSHGAITKYKKENLKNWQESGYKDKPVNSFAQDGLVSLDDIDIFTRGNNEFNMEDENKIVLFRSVDYLGKPNLEDRPGVVSGLPLKVNTPDALLHKKLSFDLMYTFNKKETIKNLNNWNIPPIFSFTSQVNPIIHAFDRFVINEKSVKNKIEKPAFKNLENSELIISRVMKKKNKIISITSNPYNKKVGDYKPYEIKINE